MPYGGDMIRSPRIAKERRLRARRRLGVAAVIAAMLAAVGGSLAGVRPLPPSAPGRALALTSEDAIVLSLPFPAGEARRLVQGYDGGFTHRGDDRLALDFGMREGDPVLASADGTVSAVVTGWGNTYPSGPAVLGNHVRIQHGAGVGTVYGHLLRVLVREDQQVLRGQLIGLAGDSGYSTGPHVHVRVTRHGMPIVPEPMSGYRSFRPGETYLSDNIASNTREGSDVTPPSGRLAAPKPGASIPASGSIRLAGRFADNVAVSAVALFWRYTDEEVSSERFIGMARVGKDGVFTVEWDARLRAGRLAVLRAAPCDGAGNWNWDVESVHPVVRP